MTRLGQMIYDDGVENGIKKGIEQGIEQGTEQMSLLTQKLLAEDRLDDLKRATKDKDFREKLMKEFNLD